MSRAAFLVGPGLPRRALLLGTGGMALVAGAGVGIAVAAFGGRLPALLVRLIRRRLPYVDIADDDVAAFAADFAARRAARRDGGIGPLDLASTVPGLYLDRRVRALLPRDLRTRIEAEEAEILTQFLMATDFFSAGRPASRRVRYVGPGGVCTNPFARLA
jgi:hypothetical protein